MTATAFTSVSVEPPIILVCMNSSSRTAAAALEEGRFAVNILASDQTSIAKRFARSGDDKFAGIQTMEQDGIPLLIGTAATVLCSVRTVSDAGTHKVVLGDVLACASPHIEGVLVYLDGSYKTLPLDPD